MKKLFALLTTCLFVVSIQAQIELIRMTTNKSIGEIMEINILSSKPYSIDWGNGEKLSYSASKGNYVDIAKSELKGSTIKIYGESNGFTYLSCISNLITTIDVKNATSLEHLYCYFNQISSLDVSKNTLLKYLLCSYNALTELNANNNPVLRSIDCESNQLTKLEVDKDIALSSLRCSNNKLTDINISNNTKLVDFTCQYNKLKIIDLSKNTALTNLECGYNQILNLDLTKNTALNTLFCSNNQLNTITISKNTPFTTFYSSNNDLNSKQLNEIYDLLPDITSVIIGQYDPIWKKKLILEGNYGLLVSNTKIATDKGWICDIEGGQNIPELTELISMTTLKNMDEDISFVIQSLKTFAIDWGNGEKVGYIGYKGNVPLNKSSKIKGNNIKIYGDKTSVISFWCTGSQLSTLDISKNPALTSLDCSNNLITNLIIGEQNSKLLYLYCYDNKIKGEAMTALMNSLDEQSVYSKGELFVIETSNPDEGNVALKTDVAIAYNKNWTVWRWLGSREQSLPYIGSDPTSINELQAQGTHIYNTIGYLHIDNDTPRKICIFTLDGRMIVEQFSKYLNVPVSSGIYIVKIDNTAMKVKVK